MNEYCKNIFGIIIVVFLLWCYYCGVIIVVLFKANTIKPLLMYTVITSC